jgi:tripartite-type tricarboxylate transporter receptor subunit TctC
VLLTLLLTIMGGRAAYAGTYPTKPITFIIPWSVGGGTDVTARAVVASSAQYLNNQPLVPISKPGASGVTAHIAFLKARPDGYELILTGNSPIVTVPFFESVPYDPLNDFKFICRLTNLRNAIAVNKTVAYKTAEEFIAYAKAHPGEIRVSHAGAQSVGEMSIRLLELEAGIDLTEVPFDGGGPSLIACAGGHVEATSNSLTALQPQIDAGNIIPLALTAIDRHPAYPDIPTFMDLGYNVVIDNQICVGAPKNTPKDIIDYLAEAFKKTLEDPGYISLAEKLGVTIDYLGPEDTLKSIRTTAEAVEKVVKAE